MIDSEDECGDSIMVNCSEDDEDSCGVRILEDGWEPPLKRRAEHVSWEAAAEASSPSISEIPQQPGGGWEAWQVLECGRAMLDRLSDTSIVGERREKTLSYMKNLISMHLETPDSALLWLTGPNGTGKTTSIKWALDGIKKDKVSHRSVYVCCSTLQKMSRHRLIKEISRQLEIDPSGLFERLCDKLVPVVVVVDEVDALFTKKRSGALLPILEFPFAAGCSSTFVFISNSRMVPYSVSKKIRSRMGTDHFRFQPYSHEEMVEIVRYKLCGNRDRIPEIASLLLSEDVIRHVAISFSKIYGDCRRVMSAVKRIMQEAVAAVGKIPPETILHEKPTSTAAIDRVIAENTEKDCMTVGISGMPPHVVSMLASVHKRFLLQRRWSELHGCTCIPLMDALGSAMEDWKFHNVECTEGMCVRDALVEMHRLELMGYVKFYSRMKRGRVIDPERDWMLVSLTSSESLMNGSRCETAKKIIECYPDV